MMRSGVCIKQYILNGMILLLFLVLCGGQITGVFCWYMTRQFLTMIFMVLGVTIEMMSGILDLSIAAEISAATCVGASLIAAGLPVWLAVPGMLLFHVLIGGAKGFLIAKLPVNPVVITLAVQVILSNIAGILAGSPLILENQQDLYGSSLFWGGMAAVLVVVTIFLGAVFKKSYYGRYMRMLGEDPEAVKRSGLNDGGIRMILCGAASLVTGIGSVGILMITNVGSPQNGNHYLYPVLAAAVLGGANFLNGRGNLAGAYAGTFAMILFLYMMIAFRIPKGAETALEGILMISAIALSLSFSRPGIGVRKRGAGTKN